MSGGEVEEGKVSGGKVDEVSGGKVAWRRFDVAPLACGRSHISS